MTADRREQVYAVLVALQGDTLVIPNAAVAEVTAHDGMQPAQGGPEWLLGSYLWNGRRTAVVSFEALNGGPRPELGRRARLVVLNSLGGQGDSLSVAILSQGYPHLVTLNRTAVRKEALRDQDRPELVLARVRIANTQAAIPDLTVLQQELAAHRSVEAGS